MEAWRRDGCGGWGGVKTTLKQQERGPKAQSSWSAEYSAPLTLSNEKRETLYSLTNAPDPTNSPDPRSPATGANDDRVGAVESDEAI